MSTNDERILRTWHNNVAPWTKAVRAGEIASRVAVTNDAILGTVHSVAPAHLLDLGCGEGWICHALARTGVSTVGVDAVPGLVAAAAAGHPADASPGVYLVRTYDEIAAGALDSTYHEAFDAVVCNFSLFGDDSVTSLLRALPALLRPQGKLVIQTLHSVAARGDAPYTDGWREGSWAGFSDAFTDPAPWYFRTLSSWIRLLHDSGFRLREMREPVNPATNSPASVIFVAERMPR